MIRRIVHCSIALVLSSVMFLGCKAPGSTTKTESKTVPAMYGNSQDSTNTAGISWKQYFSDPNLAALIETALENNQELNIIMQEIEIGKNEIRARKGEYLPVAGLQGSAGVEKEGRYTRHGAVDHNIEIKPGTEFPEPLNDYMIGAYASWELDVWKKLRNAKKSAVARYLSSVEGKNFMVTNLVAEIADSYYELMGLDNMLEIVQKNIDIQSDALHVVKQQKESAKVTQLAVNRFEAQLLNTQNLQFEIKQQIIETENRINFLLGRFPQPIQRSSGTFNEAALDSVQPGIPSQLLSNRADIRQSEMELTASKLDVKVARANFFPSFRIEAGVGLQAFNPAFLVHPESILYNLAGDAVAPLINRNAIKAAYNSASAKQVQAVYDYERTVLNAYMEVVNRLAENSNYIQSYNTKSKEVEILTQSINISNNLFRSARADYAEVLLTQHEALESKMELIEIKMKLMKTKVDLYQALGGGWK